jgi:hypothetical protein
MSGVYGGTPRRVSAKLIFRTMMKGMRKNSSSQIHGIAITSVRPVNPSRRNTPMDQRAGGRCETISKNRSSRELMRAPSGR